MRNYEIGYRKPPKKTRFKPGVSGNPKGRPKRGPSTLAKIIQGVLSAPIEYRDKGRLKEFSREEFIVKTVVDHAITGDVGAAEMLLQFRSHAEQFGAVGIDRLEVGQWLPDYPGQTADQKTRAFSSAEPATPLEWWSSSQSQARSGKKDQS